MLPVEEILVAFAKRHGLSDDDASAYFDILQENAVVEGDREMHDGEKIKYVAVRMWTTAEVIREGHREGHREFW